MLPIKMDMLAFLSIIADGDGEDGVIFFVEDGMLPFFLDGDGNFLITPRGGAFTALAFGKMAIVIAIFFVERDNFFYNLLGIIFHPLDKKVYAGTNHILRDT